MKNKGLNLPIAAPLIAAQAAAKTTNFMKENWKWILGFTALGIGSYAVYKQFFADDPAPELKENPNYPPSSLSKFDAKNLADRLYNAMKVPGSTDEDAILDILEGKHYNDFARISNAFGGRDYNYSIGGVTLWPLNSTVGLADMLINELKEEELTQIQLVMPNVITGTKPLTEGRDVVSKANGLKAYLAENVDGTWHRRNEVIATYNQNEEIGTIIKVMKDPEGRSYALINKDWELGDWSFNDVFVDATKIEAI